MTLDNKCTQYLYKNKEQNYKIAVVIQKHIFVENKDNNK